MHASRSRLQMRGKIACQHSRSRPGWFPPAASPCRPRHHCRRHLRMCGKHVLTGTDTGISILGNDARTHAYADSAHGPRQLVHILIDAGSHDGNKFFPGKPACNSGTGGRRRLCCSGNSEHADPGCRCIRKAGCTQGCSKEAGRYLRQFGSPWRRNLSHMKCFSCPCQLLALHAWLLCACISMTEWTQRAGCMHALVCAKAARHSKLSA